MNAAENITKKVVVSGKGDTKQNAFASALNDIQAQILKESKDVLLRIEPVSVQILTAEEQTYTERFLFFFFPRERTQYEVRLEVTVAIQQIALDQVSFTEKQVADPQGIALPFLSKRL